MKEHNGHRGVRVLPDDLARLAKLKVTQKAMLEKAARDFTLKSIAESLGVSIHTVWRFTRDIYYQNVEAPKDVPCPCCGRK